MADSLTESDGSVEQLPSCLLEFDSDSTMGDQQQPAFHEIHTLMDVLKVMVLKEKEFVGATWSETLEKLWSAGKQRKTQRYVEALEDYFQKTRNCFECALVLSFDASDFNKNRIPSQSVTVMYIFKDWVSRHPERYAVLTDELRGRALDYALSQMHVAMVDLVCQAYRLTDRPLVYLHVIHELSEKNSFHEAYTIAIRLNLQEYLPLYEVAMPLYFLDKITLLDKYLADHVAVQEEMVRHLDDLYRDSRPARDVLSTLVIDKEHFNSKLHPKTLSKAIVRLLKVFDLADDLCPNMKYNRSKRAMRYMVHQRYGVSPASAHECSGPGWREVVLQVVQVDRRLQVDLLNELMRKSQHETALGFALKLRLPEERWPADLAWFRQQYFPRDLTEDMLPAWCLDNISQDTVPCLRLELDLSCVHMVDTAKGFLDCIQSLKGYTLIGMDAEWMPTMGLGLSRLSVLQLAVRDGVYILDMLELSDKLSEEAWAPLYTEVLAAKSIRKLGYGIADDIKLVAETAVSPLAKFENVVDFAKLVPKLRQDFSVLLLKPENSSDSRKGLSELTRMVLGLPLNKDEQCSNWENRPLREAQLRYAALDAYCLLQIYDKLHTSAAKKNVDLKDLFPAPSDVENAPPMLQVQKPNGRRHVPEPENWD